MSLRVHHLHAVYNKKERPTLSGWIIFWYTVYSGLTCKINYCKDENICERITQDNQYEAGTKGFRC